MGQGNCHKTKIASERKLLKSWVSRDFPDDPEVFYSYCIGGSEKRPLYLSHIPLATQFGELSLDVYGKNTLGAAYVYLIASYYMIDALVDGHTMECSEMSSRRLSIDVGSVISKSASLFIELFDRFRPSKVKWCSNRLSEIYIENSIALKEEFIFRKSDTEFNKSEEFRSMWARSNPFLFLFEVCSTLGNEFFSEEDSKRIKDILYFLQWGDDISDWREDFIAKKHTPFIRLIIKSKDEELTVEEVEEQVYLSGIYELKLQEIVLELDRIEKELCSRVHNGLRSFVRMHKLKTSAYLKEISELKGIYRV